MKIFILFMLMTASVFAHEEIVVREVKRSEYDHTLRIEENSFESNINGYSCPWPGLRDPFIYNYYAELKHGLWDYDRDVLALKEDELDHEFCDRVDATAVFGPEFIVGNELKMKVLVVKEIIKIGEHQYLLETVTSRLSGRNLVSKAYVQLDE